MELEPKHVENKAYPVAELSTREVNGFTAMVLSTLFSVAYFGWALFPDTFGALFTTELVPDRYWALAVPMLICVSTLLATVVYIGLSLRMNPHIDNYRTFCDTDIIVDRPSDPSNVNRLKHLFENNKCGEITARASPTTTTQVFTLTKTSPPLTRSRTRSKSRVATTTTTQTPSPPPPTATTTTMMLMTTMMTTTTTKRDPSVQQEKSRVQQQEKQRLGGENHDHDHALIPVLEDISIKQTNRLLYRANDC